MKVSDKYAILRSFESCLMQIEDILSDKTTNNIQLYRLGRRIFGDRFVNVFTADDNIKLHNGQFCIVNTDASNKAGLHWLAVYKHKNKYYVFDSFGRDVHKLSKYFKYKHWTNVEFNRIESYRQNNCGQLCLAWLVIFDKYKTRCIGVI